MREMTMAKRSVYKTCRYCDLSRICNGKKCFKNKAAKTRGKNFLHNEIDSEEEE